MQFISFIFGSFALFTVSLLVVFSSIPSECTVLIYVPFLFNRCRLLFVSFLFSGINGNCYDVLVSTHMHTHTPVLALHRITKMHSLVRRVYHLFLQLALHTSTRAHKHTNTLYASVLPYQYLIINWL